MKIKPDFPPRLLLSNSLSCDGPAWGSKPSGRVSGSSMDEGSSFAIEVLLTGLEFRDDDAPLMWSSWAVEEESISNRHPKNKEKKTMIKKKHMKKVDLIQMQIYRER